MSLFCSSFSFSFFSFLFIFWIMAGVKPNILITGTPGTGKTTLSEMVASASLLRHVNVGQLIKDKKLHDNYIPEFDSYELNEDKVGSTSRH